MEDREIVAAIVAGDPAGLAEAYDRYAAALYTYAKTMLRGSADASDAVQDTFVIASTKLGQLRDPDRLRTWLYAVARNECYRRLRGREITPGLDEVPEVTDEAAAVGAGAERAELRQLVQDALIGMNTGDREVIELMIRHDFEGNELSEALGVSRNHAHAMLSRARNQLKTSLGALLVARTGRRNCALLNDMLASWDGRMTILLRKQVNRHIENCDVCEDRRRRELAPAALFSLVPLAAVPPGLRERILRLCSDDSPLSARQRQRVIEHAGTFGPDGFPAAPAVPMSVRMRAARRGTLFAVPAAVALIVAVVIVLALAATGSPPASPASAGGAIPSQPPAPAGPSASGPAQGTSSSKPAASTGAGPAHGAVTTPASVLPTQVAPATVASTTAAPRSSAPSRTPSHPPTHTPTHRATPTPPHTSAPPSSPPPRSPSPSPSPPATTAPVRGTLSVSVTAVTLAVGANGGAATGAFTLTANGGPVVGYTVTIPASADGLLTASPASGVLGAGQSVSVTLTLSRPESFDQTITINPGGLPVTVTYSPPRSDTQPGSPERRA